MRADDAEGSDDAGRPRRNRQRRDRRERTDAVTEEVTATDVAASEDAGQLPVAEAASLAAPVAVATEIAAPVAPPAEVTADVAAPAPVAAEVAAPVAQAAAPYTLPLSDLQALAQGVGLEWVNSDADRVRAVQEAIANEPKPVHVPRERKPAVVLDEGPLILVETRKDLNQVTLPFETNTH